MQSKLKLLQLDHESHADERHDHPEALFVARGEINLIVDGTAIAIKKGSMYVVPSGATHSVEAIGEGSVVVFD